MLYSKGHQSKIAVSGNVPTEIKSLTDNIANERFSKASLLEPNIEIEFRYHSFNKLLGQISRGDWLRVKEALDYLSSFTKPIEYKYNTKVYSQTGLRIRERIYSSPNKLIERVAKENIRNIDSPETGLRLSINRETELSKDQFNIFNPDLMMWYSTRYSYIYPFSDGMRIDVTQDFKKEVEYHVELELVDKTIKADSMGRAILAIWRILHGSYYTYLKSEYMSLVNTYNGNLSPNYGRQSEFDPNGVYQPRNLQKSDLSHGGIIDPKGKIVVEDKRSEVPGIETSGKPMKADMNLYRVGFKTDGIRKILITQNKKIWLITPPDNLTFLGSTTEDFGINIFDGEIITYYPSGMLFNFTGETLESNRFKSDSDFFGNKTMQYWMYDCMFIDNKIDIMSATHRDRIENGQNKLEQIYKSFPGRDKGIKTEFLTKTFNSFVTVEDFYNVINRLYYSDPPYPTDGFIFYPLNMPANSTIHRLPLYIRKKNIYVDVLKWKPPEKLTIDFKIDKISRQLLTYHVLGKREIKEVEFTGTSRFNTVNVDWDNNIITNASDFSIIEFAFTSDILIPVRLRTDKPFPNKLEVVEDTWELMNVPITLSTILGEDLTLLRYYHNGIKLELLNEVKQRFMMDQKPLKITEIGDFPEITLLDLGSGTGADISKWKINFDKIIAVEPNKESVRSLSNRIKSIWGIDVRVIDKQIKEQIKDRIVIINSKAEDIDLIANVVSFVGKVDVISSLLSIGLINTEKLFELIKRINPKYFLFMGADSLLVRETFNPIMPNPGVIIGNKLEIQLKYMTPNVEIIHDKSRDIWTLVSKEIDVGSKTINKTVMTFNKKPDIRSPDSIILEYFPDKDGIYIRLPGTVVDQYENLFNPDKFMKMTGYHPLKVNRADKEDFLNIAEKIISSLYSYGIFFINN